VSIKQSPIAVVDVLKEGRCSLITAYVLVCFNILYAIIQLFMTCFLNNVGLKFGDYTYLIQDLFFSLLLGLAISNTPPAEQLSVELPPKSLFSRGLMVKLGAQAAIFPAVQAITLQALYMQTDWFDKYQTDEPLTESFAYEESCLNIVALAQLMISSVVIAVGAPFRKAWYTNYLHTTLLWCQGCWILYLMYGPQDVFMHAISNKHVPAEFTATLLAIIAFNVIISAAASKLADFLF
jgi:cation-transporting ATPase 13A2